jgi:hypothetical protein
VGTSSFKMGAPPWINAWEYPGYPHAGTPSCVIKWIHTLLVVVSLPPNAHVTVTVSSLTVCNALCQFVSACRTDDSG